MATHLRDRPRAGRRVRTQGAPRPALRPAHTHSANSDGLQLACLIWQVRELCDELLGPVSLDAPAPSAAAMAVESGATGGAGGASGGWEKRVLGLDKNELLRDVVLPALSTNRALQAPNTAPPPARLYLL